MKEINQKLTQASIDMLLSLHRKNVSKRAKELMKTFLGRGTASDRDPLFWPAGFLLLGLVESGIANAPDSADPTAEEIRAACLQAVTDYLERRHRRKDSIRYADDALAGYAALRLWEETGDAEARDTAAEVYRFLADAPRDEAGSIIYHPSASNRCIYADGAGMTAVFLAACGRHDGSRQGYDLLPGADQPVGDTGLSVSAFAERQIDNYLKYGMDERTGLPYHGYLLEKTSDGDHTSVKKGLIGWGRAVGFLLMGMSEICRVTEISGENSHDSRTEQMDQLIRNVLSFRRQDGLFSWLLTAPEGHIDTSASAMIGWAMHNRGDASADEADSIQRIAEGLRQHITEDGRVTDCLAECVDFAEHPQRYGTYPWGQGAVTAFLSHL